MDTMFNIRVPFANGAGVAVYFQNPYDRPCTLRNVRGVACGAFGSAETITITENSGSTSLGVMTFAGTVAAADVGAWVQDTTDGDHVIGADEVIKILPSTGSAAYDAVLTLELDPHCLTGLV